MDRLLFALNDMRRKIGLVPDDSRQIKANKAGEFERFTIEGESKSKKSGVLFFFDDGGYWAMDHKTGQSCNGSQGRKGQQTNAPKREPDPKKDQERIKLQDLGRKIAVRLLSTGIPLTSTPFGTHDYIDKKEISHHGLMVCDDTDYQFRKGWLMVKLEDKRGLCNIQFISPSGEKRFIKGAKKKGAYGCFGIYEKGMPILMAEGMATARTLYDTLVMPVFFGIDATNLTHALATVIDKYKIDARITQISMAADYDINGVGEKHAKQALLDNDISVNQGSLFVPNFNVNTDWNDVFTRYKNGKNAIEQIFAALK